MLDKNIHFESYSDQRDFNIKIKEGYAVILQVTSRNVAKKYKYKMFIPILSIRDDVLYSSDIYTKSDFCKSCTEVGIYSNYVTCVKIMKFVKLDDLKIKVAQYYIDLEKENTKTVDLLLSLNAWQIKN